MHVKTRIPVLGAVSALCLVAPWARAQDAPLPDLNPPARTIYVWSSTKGASNSRLGDWGNGKHIVTKEESYEGDDVLKLTTRNFYEGVRFDLNPPADLAPYRQTGFVRMRLRFKTGASAAPANTAGPAGGAPAGGGPNPAGPAAPAAPRPAVPGGGGGGFGGFGGFGVLPVQPETRGLAQFDGGALPPLGAPTGPGGGLPGGGGGFPGAPGEGGTTAPAGPPEQKTPITNLQVTLVLDKGVVTGLIPVDLKAVTPDDDGWRLFVLPVKEMHATPDAAGAVKRVLLTSDQEDSYYMAQLALVIETGQMTATIRRPSDPPGTQIAEITVKPGVLSLVADVEAGAADPEILWNFDADNVGNLPPPANTTPAPTTAAGGTPGAPAGGGGPAAGGGAAGGGEGAAPALTGPRIDARGLIAKFEYPNEEQNYRVEVTVRDRSGKKKPVTASLLVQVRA